ncbi:MAG: hypothetical protein JKY48_02870 [Flavobacteriales bacterium]|nr:hypothetical protein [Flavobacteriales bacterium]
MNIREQLLVTHSKANTLEVTSYIGRDPERLEELMNCFFSNEYRVTQRSAMAVSNCFDQHPDLMRPYLETLISNLSKEDIHIAVKRNTVRILQFIPIPEESTSLLFDYCLAYLIDSKETIAVKAFSMGILYNICKRYPELKHEVVPILEEEMERNDSAGILSRGRKILRQINKL